MNRLWMLLLVLALLGLSARSARADFAYANFATANSTSGGQTLQVNGSASVGYLGNQLQLTPSSPSQGGSAFTTNAISLGNNGSFSTHFQFQLSNSGGIGDEDGSGADGIVFVVQTVSNNVGAAGGGIGYLGIPKSIGVEFDTFDNGEISGNHVGVDENGSLQDFGAVNEPTPFNNGQIWNAWIDYDRYASKLEVRWSLLPTRPASSMLTLGGVNLPAILGTNDAFVGFTSGTGSGYNDQDILNWQFKQINQSFWTGVTDTGWATPNNWLGPVPGTIAGTTNGDTAIFDRSAPHSPLTIDAERNLKNITFDTSNVNSLTIGTTGGNALRLTADGTIQTTSTVVNSQVINCPLILEGDYAVTSGASSSSATLRLGGRITPGATSGTTTLTVNGANTGANTISGVLADSGSGILAVTKSGAGVWVLIGNNAYTGGTTINDGMLLVTQPGSLPRYATPGQVAVGSFATLTVQAGGVGEWDAPSLQTLLLSNAFAGGSNIGINVIGTNSFTYASDLGTTQAAKGLVKLGSGTLTLTSANGYTGGTTINVGTLLLGNTAAVQNSTVTLNVDNGLAFAAALGSASLGGLVGTGSFALQDKASSPVAVNLTVGGNGASTTYSGELSGTGGVTKVGGGTLSFLGNNTYTGVTNINAGVLQLGDGATVNGSVAGNISDNATLAFANPNAQSYSGVISGSGVVTKVGAGTLSLLGINTCTGVTTVNAGAITLGATGALQNSTVNVNADNGLTFAAGLGSATLGGLSGSGSFALQDKASSPVAVNLTVGGNGASTTYSGELSGTGGVTKVGGGTLSFLGNNTYTGVTNINAGVLQLGDGATVNGSVAGNISDNATLAFANPNAQSYSGVISGSGVVTKVGAGTLSLLGINTCTGVTTVNAGAITLGATGALQNSTVNVNADNGLTFAAGLGSATLGGLSGSGSFALQDKASSPVAVNLTVGGNGASTTYSGELSGTGGVTKVGGGTLSFLGNNTYTGVTNINAGVLQLGDGATVNGSVAGNISDNATLAFANPNAQSYSGVISGSGVVTKVGTGMLSLLGINTYTGATTINAGMLQLGDGATVNGSVAGNISDNTALVFANPNAQSYSGVISGSGGVTKSGAGILALAGASTYTGGTAFNSGGLQIAGPTTISGGNIASSPIGRGTLTLAAGTTLRDDGAARTLANNLVINGNVTFASAGTGNLTISPTGLTTATNVVVHNNPTFTLTNTTTIKSVIDGPGQSLTKSGAGILIFGGANDYTGGTTINAGTLTLNAGGSLGAGPLTITAASGVHPTLNLFASQTVSSITANASGTGSTTINIASPGTALTSSGTLSESGTLNVNGGGTLEIDGAPSIAANSHIFVSNDTTRFNITTGSPTVGAGTTAIVNVDSTLELAGSVSALSSATNRVNITTVATSKGVLVSGTNQRVGQINGAGTVVINAGSDLTADRIIQSALVIQGSAGSAAVVTIDASDFSGNPLASSVRSIWPLSSNEVDAASPGLDGSIASTSVAGLAILPDRGTVNPQDVGVPEPSSLVMLAFAALGAKALVRTKRRPSSGMATIR